MNYDYCNGRIHTIKKGDTLYKISGMYRVPLALILRANPYVDIYNLQVGEKLCIPGGFDNETKPQKPSCPERCQQMPGMRVPGMPDNSGMTGMQNMPGMPDMSGMPEMQDMQRMPEMPGMSDMQETSDYTINPDFSGEQGLRVQEEPSGQGNSCRAGFVFIVKEAEPLQAVLERFDLTMEEFLADNKPETIMLQPGMAVKIPEKGCWNGSSAFA